MPMSSSASLDPCVSDGSSGPSLIVHSVVNTNEISTGTDMRDVVNEPTRGQPNSDMSSSTIKPHLDRFLSTRQPPKTFCPSEVARALTANDLQRLGCENWREAMSIIREVVWERRKAGECEVLQKGEVLGMEVELEDVRGPIRVRRTEAA
ncbi:unnamed protein product [Zymoseptoria tritici ST99CH_1A5]|nr:unnamed protein product [Zymoseptoria tritici ST99CH_1E4]SMY18578.1 unnamed protein product [Zymoseptoria tritici ST99CH_1A5]